MKNILERFILGEIDWETALLEVEQELDRYVFEMAARELWPDADGSGCEPGCTLQQLFAGVDKGD